MEKFGTYTNDATGTTVSFSLLDAASQQEIEAEKKSYQNSVLATEVIKMEEFSVAVWGIFNRLPNEVKELIQNNHLLPEILSKQTRFMYGDGPTLYQVKKVGEGENKRKIRESFEKNEHPAVWAWLESWEQNGLPEGYLTYLKKVIREYYYLEGYFSRFYFNKSRRINGSLPVRGLEFLKSDRCRLAKKGEHDINYPLEDEELKHVLYGRWDVSLIKTKTIFPRLNRANPLQYANAVSYVKDMGFGDEAYSIPTFFYGLKDWIKGSNINPKYINSYLKNSLNAKIHVLIPDAWFKLKESTLKTITQKNQELQREGKDMITEYEGLTNIGPRFSYSMISKLVKIKMKEVTEVLSGEGENQGKAFISRSFKTDNGIEEWQFKDIPTKFKEFVDSILSFDKRGVEVILQGKGLPPSISNVSKDGVFNSSGSDTYYNYLIYLNSLTYAEEFICEDINRALHLNFPTLKQQNIFFGFDRNVPARQEELAPKERIENTTK